MLQFKLFSFQCRDPLVDLALHLCSLLQLKCCVVCGELRCGRAALSKLHAFSGIGTLASLDRFRVQCGRTFFDRLLRLCDQFSLLLLGLESCDLGCVRAVLGFVLFARSWSQSGVSVPLAVFSAAVRSFASAFAVLSRSS